MSARWRAEVDGVGVIVMGGSKADSARRGRGGRAEELAPDDPAAVRSVAIVGPMAAGKTTLVEELLTAAGAIPRAGSVAAGTTVTDHDPDARRQQRSVAPAVASLVHRDIKINLIDTPGCPDFLAEVRAGLRAADAVLFVVGTADAADGVAAPTSALLAECRRAGLPAVLVLSRLDHARADEDAALATCREVAAGSGEVLVPVTRSERAPDGTVTVHPLLAGDDPTAEEPDDLRRELVETLIEQSEDEALLESWIGGEPVALDALCADLATAVARRSLVPVAGVCAPTGAGLDALLDLVVDAVPPPTAHPPLPAHAPDGAGHDPVDPDPDGPLVAEVVHTGTDAQGSRVSLVRVFSGRLRPDTALTVCADPLRIPDPRDGEDPTGAEVRSGGETVRVNRVYAPLGATLREVPWCVAGDLCALTRLGPVGTGDTLCAAEDPVGLDGWELPEALLPVAVTAADRTAQDAMARGSPAWLPRRPRCASSATRTPTRSCCGARARPTPTSCSPGYGPRGRTSRSPTSQRPSARRWPAPRRARAARQAVGRARPVRRRPSRSSRCRAGRAWSSSTGSSAGRSRGPTSPASRRGSAPSSSPGSHRAGPSHVRVTLVDGKAHSVDSSDQAFQTAGALAIREAVAAGGTVVMERLDQVEVTVDDAQLGAVLGDLASRHGRVVGTEPGEPGRTHARAEVPEQALLRYAVDLRALTSGTVDHPALQPLRAGRWVAARAGLSERPFGSLPSRRTDREGARDDAEPADVHRGPRCGTPGRAREPRRHHRRVVRLLHLRQRGGAGFSQLFFTALDPATALLASFATIGVSFVARPLGGVIAGHLGDRIGRKRMLVATLLIMGLATVGVGLLPSASGLGSAALRPGRPRRASRASSTLPTAGPIPGRRRDGGGRPRAAPRPPPRSGRPARGRVPISWPPPGAGAGDGVEPDHLVGIGSSGALQGRGEVVVEPEVTGVADDATPQDPDRGIELAVPFQRAGQERQAGRVQAGHPRLVSGELLQSLASGFRVVADEDRAEAVAVRVGVDVPGQVEGASPAGEWGARLGPDGVPVVEGRGQLGGKARRTGAEVGDDAVEVGPVDVEAVFGEVAGDAVEPGPVDVEAVFGGGAVFAEGRGVGGVGGGPGGVGRVAGESDLPEAIEQPTIALRGGQAGLHLPANGGEEPLGICPARARTRWRAAASLARAASLRLRWAASQRLTSPGAALAWLRRVQDSTMASDLRTAPACRC